MFVSDPIWKEDVQSLLMVIVAMLNKLKGDENTQPMRDHFNQVVREAKSVGTASSYSRRFNRESYELAMRMGDSKALERIIMKIDTIDDVDKDIANQILQILEPAYARPEPTKKLIA